MLHYQTIPITPFQQNCSLVWEGATHTAAVIGPVWSKNQKYLSTVSTPPG
jgi:hypothetical protein